MGSTDSQRNRISTVGIDIQSIEEVADSLEKFGVQYTSRIFTAHEVESCGGDSLTDAADYATRFAAKEAVFKVLNIREVAPPWKDIEVRQDESGTLKISLVGAANSFANQQGIEEIRVSVSRDKRHAIAVVVALK